MAQSPPTLLRRLARVLVAPARRALGHARLLDWFFAVYWPIRTTAYRLARLPRGNSFPRIALISMWNEDQAALGAITAPNKAAYCQQHGYAWHPCTTGFVPDRPVAWSKIHFLREILPAYDWVMWSDVDSLITNPAIRLETLTDHPADLLITRDHIGVNSGSFLLRNCAWSRQFLDELWTLPSRVEFTQTYGLWSDRMWENRAFLLLMLHAETRRHTHFLPQRTLNSYHPEFASAGPDSRHQPGDFVLHLPGMDNARRLTILTAYAKPAGAARSPQLSA